MSHLVIYSREIITASNIWTIRSQLFLMGKISWLLPTSTFLAKIKKTPWRLGFRSQEGKSIRLEKKNAIQEMLLCWLQEKGATFTPWLLIFALQTPFLERMAKTRGTCLTLAFLQRMFFTPFWWKIIQIICWLSGKFTRGVVKTLPHFYHSSFVFAIHSEGNKHFLFDSSCQINFIINDFWCIWSMRKILE